VRLRLSVRECWFLSPFLKTLLSSSQILAAMIWKDALFVGEVGGQRDRKRDGRNEAVGK
jgi:hypothetical protein